MRSAGTLLVSATLALQGLACGGVIGELCADFEEVCNDGDDNDCDGDPDCFDADCALTPTCEGGSDDSDGDGLPDAWEEGVGGAYLDPNNADTDNDGTSDAGEDFDADGLRNIEELACARLTDSPATTPPHPLRADLLVELDTMTSRDLSPAILSEVVAAFSYLPNDNPDGTTGIAAHIYIDEHDIPAADFSGSFSERWSFFAAHGPTFADTDQPRIPYQAMVHAVVAARRADIPERAGETVADDGGDVENTGVFLFYDAISAVMPNCAMPGAVPPLPEVTVDEALANTLVHELGHTLQLGHDTDVGGGTNYWNVMSVPDTCQAAQRRFHGWQNNDVSQGNTAAVAAPRFSNAAAALIQLTNKVSVETPDLEDVDM